MPKEIESKPEESFQDITVVKEIINHSVVNDYLALGWRLLKVLSKRDEDEYAAYILGWPNPGQPVTPDER